MKEKIVGRGRVISVGMTDVEPLNTQVGKDASGNEENYSLAACPVLADSVLTGKTIYWLGSSVTYGFASCGEAVPDYMAKRNSMTCVKSAISGTTLADIPYNEEEDNPWQARVKNGNTPESCRLLAPLSYLKRLEDFPKNPQPDLVVIQLSTNDSMFPAKNQGIIAEGFEESAFDGATTFGATQLILARIRRYWNCPVLIYTSPLLNISTYNAMVEASRTIAEKWGAHILDMHGDEAFNELGRAHMSVWMNDPVHPRRQGYLEWWTPVFEEAIKEILG